MVVSPVTNLPDVAFTFVKEKVLYQDTKARRPDEMTEDQKDGSRCMYFILDCYQTIPLNLYGGMEE